MKISRRTFSKAAAGVAAGLLVPTLKVDAQNDLHRLVARWADWRDRYSSPNGSGRYDFRQPFIVDGQAYATDARAMARIATSKTDAYADEQRKLPPLVSTWERFWVPGPWRELPQPPTMKRRQGYCPACEWANAIQLCPTCDGDLIVGFDLNGRDKVCPTCNGAGEVSRPNCKVCGGKVFGEYERGVALGSRQIDVFYYRQMAAVPDVRWTLSHHSRIGYPGPVLFESPIGISGIIMPVND